MSPRSIKYKNSQLHVETTQIARSTDVDHKREQFSHQNDSACTLVVKIFSFCLCNKQNKKLNSWRRTVNFAFSDGLVDGLVSHQAQLVPSCLCWTPE